MTLVKWFDYYDYHLDPNHAFIYFAIEYAFISTIISSITNMVVISPALMINIKMIIFFSVQP